MRANFLMGVVKAQTNDYIGAMSEERLVHCKKYGKELPGLAKPPFRNELGQKIYAEISKQAWDQWLKDSVKFINTYCGEGTKYDLTKPEGQKFILDQCAVYFGFQEGDLAMTAFKPIDH